MARKILYFINPISGTRGKENLVELIESETRKAGIAYSILPTVASGDYQFAEPVIEQEGITDIVVCGGDGSVNQVVNALAHTGLPFGIVPMGSGNGLALAANISRNSQKALAGIFEGKAETTDAFLVNGQFACMLCGLGFDAQVAHEFAQQPRRGLGTYASLSTRQFLQAHSFHFIIEANGIRFPSDAFFISIANSNQFGNNFTIAPQALLSDGLLDVVIIKKSAKPMLLVHVMKQVLAGRLQKVENSLKSPVIYFQTNSLTIKNTDRAPLHIDGEPRETADQFDIRILPGFFKLIHG